MHRASTILLALLVPALGLVACRGATGGAPPQGRPTSAQAPAGDQLSPTDPVTLRFTKVDMLVSQWDAAQAAGQGDQADQLADQIRREVDAGYGEFLVAASGRRSLRLQYLSVSALGFASRSDATQALVQQLANRDSRLVGNTLIALKLRADPATSLGPVIQHVTNPAPGPRRYAPLVIANVLEARRRRGLYVDPAVERQAAHALSGVVADRDPFVRLHVAKALGALRIYGTYELLLIPLRDEHVRIRLAAAAGLERLGDPRGFPEVMALLEDVPADTRPIVRDILITYAQKLQGTPLTPDEVTRLGTSAQAWTRWFNELRERKGIKLEDPSRPASVAPAAAPPAGTTPLPRAPRSSRFPTTIPPSWKPAGAPSQPTTVPAPPPPPPPTTRQPGFPPPN